MRRVLIAMLVGGFCMSAFADEKPPLETVPKVDIARYVGLWYEIARLPNWFQEGCLESRAEYTALEKGKIKVVNSCRKKDGKEASVEGIAWIEDPVSNARLTVSFVPSWLRWTGIGKGDYWIIDLSPEYQWVVVSEPERRHLWILARKPALESAVFDAITKKLRERGFDLATLIHRK
ncbi:MAG: hypothetical protein A2428_11180 [Bdellovibrionales bacterium RIFOXYC1_FULL_54_43]|nr:MAG: hypothetical protein A2428_11180 [Bdellovibrionales bacterium RIFOXYC1_FULL_54_43]OFZ83525.1 MAG: hypothetical protein A2603_15375 [Bdellovibrionales bacterium RIFOXYD1_FULL_55_31]